MELDAERDVGIEVVSLPHPGSRGNEKGVVIGAAEVDLCVGPVADGLQSHPRGIDHRWRAVEVEIGLRTEAWIADVVRRLGEAFDDDVIDVGFAESFSGLAVSGFYALEAPRVVGDVCL